MSNNKPFLKKLSDRIKNKFSKPIEFSSSNQYWTDRYRKGGNSGAGSYNHLAEFKAEILNDFVAENNIETVIELGSGDGNQLTYFNFPDYKGFDISEVPLTLCRKKFNGDNTKAFFLIEEVSKHKAELSLSLDVLFHLVEDETFEIYMNQLFDSSTLFVIIYSSNFDDEANYENHVRHRKFTTWIEKKRPSFELIERIPNKYPPKERENKTTTSADFFIFRKAQN